MMNFMHDERYPQKSAKTSKVFIEKVIDRFGRDPSWVYFFSHFAVKDRIYFEMIEKS